MDSGGKPEVKVIIVKSRRFLRNCYCHAPVLFDEPTSDEEEMVVVRGKGLGQGESTFAVRGKDESEGTSWIQMCLLLPDHILYQLG